MNAPTPTMVSHTIEAQRHRVLVVDDSHAQRQLLSAVLRKWDLDVDVAPDAEAALAVCAAPEGASIRIIVSDWQMPGMDGPDFCRALRKLRSDDFVYVILLTSRSDPQAKTIGLEAGADDFVTRPVDMAELRARISAGRRILHMQEQLEHRNHEIQTTLGDLQALHEGINRDLAEARKLQRAFLPNRSHEALGSEVALRLLTCEQIGGDLVGYFPLSETEIALYSVDVAGHGIASALLTGRLAELFTHRSGMRNIAFPAPGAPADAPHLVMERLNAFMLQELTSDIYFTAVLAYIDLTTGAVRFCQAGHPHPLIRRADGRAEPVGAGGPPIGLIPEASFETCHAQMDPGDMFFAYSDGLTECADTWGDMLEEQGLMDLLSSAQGTAHELIRHIEDGLRDHAGIQGFIDDISMVALAFNPDGR